MAGVYLGSARDWAVDGTAADVRRWLDAGDQNVRVSLPPRRRASLRWARLEAALVAVGVALDDPRLTLEEVE